MAFDGLVNYTVYKELKDILIDGKVDKVFQPTPNEIILGVYQPGIKYALDIVVSSNNYRVCLTTSSKPNPSFAPNFCMLLRKYLIGTRITNVKTFGLERILVIEFEGYNKSRDFSTKKLIIELMGKHSNIILTNSENIIIDALKHFDTSSQSYRNILPGYKYILPISHKADFTSVNTFEEFNNILLEKQENDLNLSNLICNSFTGISCASILNLCKELNIPDVYSEENIKRIYNGLINLINNIPQNIICISNENGYKLQIDTNKEKLQVNFFLDDYYTQKETNDNFLNYRHNLSKLILNYFKKLNNKLASIDKKLAECKNTETYRLYGELITNNLYRIPNKNVSEISLENYYDNNNIITIPLDKSISPAYNAKKYFKKYNKLKNAKEIVTIQKQEVQKEIEYIESIVYSIEACNSIQDINEIHNEFEENVLSNTYYNAQKRNNRNNKKQINSKKSKKVNSIGEPIKFTIDGFTILVGKNNKQNDYITKQANSDDIWFHTKDIHGSHTILKTNGKAPTQETINKCAAIAAYHSKASQTSNVPVDYTEIKYVKKPSGAKPGMVNYTNYKNVIVKPKIDFEE